MIFFPWMAIRLKSYDLSLAPDDLPAHGGPACARPCREKAQGRPLLLHRGLQPGVASCRRTEGAPPPALRLPFPSGVLQPSCTSVRQHGKGVLTKGKDGSGQPAVLCAWATACPHHSLCTVYRRLKPVRHSRRASKPFFPHGRGTLTNEACPLVQQLHPAIGLTILSGTGLAFCPALRQAQPFCHATPAGFLRLKQPPASAAAAPAVIGFKTPAAPCPAERNASPAKTAGRLSCCGLQATPGRVPEGSSRRKLPLPAQPSARRDARQGCRPESGRQDKQAARARPDGQPAALSAPA